MGFKSCLADVDVWMSKNDKPDGFQYWEYCLCYVDDVLVISHAPQKFMDGLSKRYTLKRGSVKEPDLYLGAQISMHMIPGSDDPTKIRWAMSLDDYVKSITCPSTADCGFFSSLYNMFVVKIYLPEWTFRTFENLLE